MKDREIQMLAAAGLVLFYLTCGVLAAGLFGFEEWTLTWFAAVAMWPVPLTILIIALIAVTYGIAVIVAVVKGQYVITPVEARPPHVRRVFTI